LDATQTKAAAAATAMHDDDDALTTRHKHLRSRSSGVFDIQVSFKTCLCPLYLFFSFSLPFLLFAHFPLKRALTSNTKDTHTHIRTYSHTHTHAHTHTHTLIHTNTHIRTHKLTSHTRARF
jgi:hypothetical protein